MDGFWQSPEMQGGVIPFAVAFAAAILIRLLFGKNWGGRLAILGAVIGFLAAYFLLEGITWPAVAAKQKIFWLALVALILGLAMELRGGGRLGALVIAHLFPIGALAWLAWGLIGRGLDQELLIKLAALYLGSVFVIWMMVTARLPRDRDTSIGCGRINSPAMLLVAAFATGLIALYGAEIGLAQLLIAIGAVLGAVLLLSYLSYVIAGDAFKFGPVGVIGVAGAWLSCIYVLVLFGDSPDLIALAIVLLIFALNMIARRVRFGSGLEARVVEPILYGAIVTIPAVAAAAYVLLTAAPDTGY